MKRFLIITILFSPLVPLHAQGPLQPILKTYFRTHPFDTRFSTFINSLQKDPWFTIETYDRRTDSSFFYLSGTYKNFNPYRFVPREVRLVIAEGQFVHSDSLRTLDTVINLQLMGISDSTAAGKNAVIKEFKRFHSNKGYGFSNHVYTYFENEGATTAEIYNYFIFPFQVPPVTAAWGQVPGTNQYTFTITIRFKLKENIADLIISPDDLPHLN